MIAISNEPVQVHLVGRSRSDKLSIARPTPALLYHACKILENPRGCRGAQWIPAQNLATPVLSLLCRASFLFAASVTDESYGVNTARFEEGGWSVDRALWVNIFSNSSWTISNVVGVLVGSAVGIPLSIASFAMTSIFICLLVTQKISIENVVAAVVAMVGVFLCKLAGLTGPAILVGAIAGVVAAMLANRALRAKGGDRA